MFIYFLDGKLCLASLGMLTHIWILATAEYQSDV